MAVYGGRLIMATENTMVSTNSILNRWPTLVIASVIVVGIGFQLLPIAVARAGAVLVLVVQVLLERRAGSSNFLTSPLFLLGAVALVFYSLIVGVSDIPVSSTNIEDIDTLFGSDAERAIVVFGLACIAMHAIAAQNPETAKAKAGTGPDQGTFAIYLFATIAVIISMVNVGNYLSMEFGGPHIGAIRSVAAPAIAFCLLFLVHQSVRTSVSLKILIVVIIALSIAGMFYIQEGKKPLMILLAALLFWLRLKNVSLARLVAVGVTTVVVAIVLLQIMQMIRVPHGSMVRGEAGSTMRMFKDVLTAKLVMRQMETQYCFQSVIDKHRGQSFAPSRQLFWLQGLVPRALWPKKPNLSLGKGYALDYCGLWNGGPHSASITLLGQPVLHGGGAGLLLHGGFLLFCLGGLVWINRNPDSLSAVSIAALLPWLIDFDQDFALYTANAVKFFLVMAPLIWLAAAQSRFSRSGARLQ